MTIDTLCPELITLKENGKIKDPHGNVITLDTTVL